MSFFALLLFKLKPGQKQHPTDFKTLFSEQCAGTEHSAACVCGTFLLNIPGPNGLFINFQDGAFVKTFRETSLLALQGFPRLVGLFQM